MIKDIVRELKQMWKFSKLFTVLFVTQIILITIMYGLILWIGFHWSQYAR